MILQTTPLDIVVVFVFELFEKILEPSFHHKFEILLIPFLLWFESKSSIEKFIFCVQERDQVPFLPLLNWIEETFIMLLLLEKNDHIVNQRPDFQQIFLFLRLFSTFVYLFIFISFFAIAYWLQSLEWVLQIRAPVLIAILLRYQKRRRLIASVYSVFQNAPNSLIMLKTFVKMQKRGRSILNTI